MEKPYDAAYWDQMPTTTCAPSAALLAQVRMEIPPPPSSIMRVARAVERELRSREEDQAPSRRE
jgi:hypothetical protein